jgi:glycosyltransferase involved in cell wall biosynthesis
MAKILAINWQDLSHPASGGAEVHLEEILSRLAQRGHQIDLFCCNYPGGKPFETRDGFNIIRRGSRSTFNWVVMTGLGKLIKNKKYDIIFEDINKIPFYTPLYQKLPLLVIIPHLFSNSIFKEINVLLGTYIYLAERPFSLVYRNNHMMVISESTAEEMINRGIPVNQVHVIKCGIDGDTYKFDSTIAKFDRPTILYVGRVKKYKSIETAIDALPIISSQIPDVRLCVIGTGDHLPFLKKRVSDLGLENRVEFLGFVPESVKVEYLRRSHLSVYPSLKEGWGLTNIEANACGTPVLAARVPGLKDSVNEGVSGLLFEYGNIDEFSWKAAKILKDHEYRHMLEKGALAHAANFSWDKTALETEDLMNMILKGHRCA